MFAAVGHLKGLILLAPAAVIPPPPAVFVCVRTLSYVYLYMYILTMDEYAWSYLDVYTFMTMGEYV
jgi:hypothetical protein